ncbi:hypothetical protein GCM10017668_11140 [Streptomyces tuirus]|uniref:Uncharacterized protein n=1 Tax=Streptomyces tuirus TaxID=68278 RepID=A0A7G1N968_9ACTN|nr:hypothetical protein GCM10017668_11140 [Streptomyces tuirus]
MTGRIGLTGGVIAQVPRALRGAPAARTGAGAEIRLLGPPRTREGRSSPRPVRAATPPATARPGAPWLKRTLVAAAPPATPTVEFRPRTEPVGSPLPVRCSGQPAATRGIAGPAPVLTPWARSVTHRFGKKILSESLTHSQPLRTLCQQALT